MVYFFDKIETNNTLIRLNIPMMPNLSILGPREAMGVVSVWMFVVAGLMVMSGFINSTFFRFGPSSNVYFFKIAIDSWFKWSVLMGYVVCNQIFTTYGLQTITPWELNCVQNRQVLNVGMPNWQALSVIEIWYMYMWLGRVISIQILLTQIDFLLMILLIDIIITFAVNKRYLDEKKRHGYMDLSMNS